ncbi:MAG: hypothetical protein P8N02_11080, partial [Actinomycetota bacterium]|nr:hypothetical protein [Actinomycetota bacterium]
MSPPQRGEVLELYEEGVNALAGWADQQVDWSAIACGEWDCADVARHVAGVADWYHQWLDRALEGSSDPRSRRTSSRSRTASRSDAEATSTAPRHSQTS